MSGKIAGAIREPLGLVARRTGAPLPPARDTALKRRRASVGLIGIQPPPKPVSRKNLFRISFFRKEGTLAPPISCLTTPGVSAPPASPDTRPSLLLRVRDWPDKVSWDEFHAIDRPLKLWPRPPLRTLACGSRGCHPGRLPAPRRNHPSVRSESRARLVPQLVDALTRWRIANRRTRQRSLGDASAASLPWTDAASDTRSPQPPPRSVGGPERLRPPWHEEWETHLLDLACPRLARRVKAKHSPVFELYSRRGHPVLEVSRTRWVNPASAYLIGRRLTRQVKAEVTALRIQLEQS